MRFAIVMKIVADIDIPFLRGVFEPYAAVVYLPGDRIAAADVRDADALLVRTRTACTASLLEGSQVKFIGTATVGSDHIDGEFCAARGIAVATAKGSNVRGVLQWVSAVLVWLSENRAMLPRRTTLGVVGVGEIGSLVRRYALHWGYGVVCSDPPRERAEGLTARDGFYSLAGVAGKSDILTFHVPLTRTGPDATYHLAGGELLSLMRPRAVLLNSSRGPVIEPGALSDARGDLGFAIDTWNGEPDIDRGVLARTLLATPHVAGYTVQGKAAATAMVVDALAGMFGLTPLRGWFPDEKLRSRPRLVSWNDLRAGIGSYYDISCESSALKSHPEYFEEMRNQYDYRKEFF